ncbi:hypothetical protein AGMMS50229_20610 [Campylobacterota bacterium]|nr:hypothetical protein AGMMS50229_20610 [Campylobacterota bacterium]
MQQGSVNMFWQTGANYTVKIDRGLKDIYRNTLGDGLVGTNPWSHSFTKGQ